MVVIHVYTRNFIMAKSKKRTKLPSMNDVAKRAGVSQTTVSFVLNKVESANISTETQERVMAAVEELGYRPNATARQLRANRTYTIGFISDMIATTPFAGRIIQGAQDVAWAHDYLLLVITTGGNQAMKLAAVETLLERRVDGILYATMYHRRAAPPPQISEVPTVLIDCFVENRTLPSVVPDEAKGGYVATKALLEKGHRRIGLINDTNLGMAKVLRLQGYKQALAEFDIAFDDSLVTLQSSDQPGGYAGLQTLLTLAEPPTALFCFNDLVAMGAYDYAHKNGIRIPADLAVVGFDNLELIAPYLDPPLTTMELPHYEMGHWAMQHLLELIKNSDAQADTQPIQHLYECPIIERSSI